MKTNGLKVLAELKSIIKILLLPITMVSPISRALLITMAFLLNISFTEKNERVNEKKWINITWVNNLKKDFSFQKEWSYPEGVYRNKFGQLDCDGICPREIDRMKNEEGKINPDSLQAFYKIIDTTHLFHSIKSEALTYEWAGTNFIKFERNPDNSLSGRTEGNVATHSSLIIKIVKDSATAWIDLNSVSNNDSHTFHLKKGKIKIDKYYFQKGIIKAEFEMTFNHIMHKNKRVYWKGLIYSKIQK